MRRVRGTTIVDGHEGKICLRDTAGQEAYDAINAASFTGVDCFLICFALRKGREASLANVTAKWHKQLKEGGHLNDGAKIILVGTQMDYDPQIPDIDAAAERVKDEIGALLYMKTSAFMARDDGGVPEVFDEAVRACMYTE